MASRIYAVFGYLDPLGIILCLKEIRMLVLRSVGALGDLRSRLLGN